MSHMGEFPAIPTALDRLDPNTSRNWIGLPSRAAGPTATDIADEYREHRDRERERRIHWEKQTIRAEEAARRLATPVIHVLRVVVDPQHPGDES